MMQHDCKLNVSLNPEIVINCNRAADTRFIVKTRYSLLESI